MTDLFEAAINVTMVFRDNKATNGGIDVYGGTPNSYYTIAVTDGRLSIGIHSWIIQERVLFLTPPLTCLQYLLIQRECVSVTLPQS